MLFTEALIELILIGRKTQTRRSSGRWRLGRQPIQGARYKVAGYIEVLDKYRQRLGDIRPEEARAEGFASVEEFQKAWTKMNGSWDPGVEVWVYVFKLYEHRAAP